MSDSIMCKKAIDFSVEIINLCKAIRSENNEYVLTNQITKSATSIGANLHEAKYAQSKADFVSKQKIALKECYETEYWLKLLHKTEYISVEDYNNLVNKCGKIRRMLISSINTTLSNNSADG